MFSPCPDRDDGSLGADARPGFWRALIYAVARRRSRRKTSDDSGGPGWGSLPRHIVEADLRENRLVQLHPMGSGNSHWLSDGPGYAADHAEVALGPAASWMFEWMKTAMASKSMESEKPRLTNRRKARG
jgi:hypothetical protein